MSANLNQSYYIPTEEELNEFEEYLNEKDFYEEEDGMVWYNPNVTSI